jgi:hypothetical protein
MFTTSENGRATIIYGYTKDHLVEVGDVITYDEMLDLLEIPKADIADPSSTLSGVISQVNKRLHQSGCWRHLINIPNVGYRIARPGELRSEVFGRMRHIERQQVTNLRAIEKVVRHPDATAGERKRAADAAATQSRLLQLVRHEQRKMRRQWPEEEVSPIPEEQGATNE